MTVWGPSILLNLQLSKRVSGVHFQRSWRPGYSSRWSMSSIWVTALLTLRLRRLGDRDGQRRVRHSLSGQRSVYHPDLSDTWTRQLHNCTALGSLGSMCRRGMAMCDVVRSGNRRDMQFSEPHMPKIAAKKAK